MMVELEIEEGYDMPYLKVRLLEKKSLRKIEC